MNTQLLILTHKMLGHLTLVLAGAGVFTAVDFSHTITLGSVLIALIVLIVAGVFQVRSKITNIWRQAAEAARYRAEQLEHELSEAKESRAAFDREQQELRHDLKDQVAELRAQLKVMEAKTDLTAALKAIHKMNEHTTDAIVAAMRTGSDLSEARDNATHKLLTEIRDKLPSEPIAVDLVHDQPPE